MKNMKRVAKTVGTLGLVGWGVMNSPLTVAADSGWTGGLSVGQSRAKIDNERITNQLLGAGFTSESIIDDSRDDFAYKIFGGYKFNKFFAVEGGYFNLGQFGYTVTTVPGAACSELPGG